MNTLPKFIQLLRVPIKYIIGAFVVSSVFVFAPNSFLASLGMLKYREKGKSYFGILLLILSVMLIAAVASIVIEETYQYFLARTRKKRLALLTAEEKNILRGYIERETRTLYLSVQSGVVKGLVHEDIIYRSASVNSPEYGALAFAHNIQPWAWKYLNEHRDLLVVHDRS